MKQRETLHTIWYRDMTALQLEANPRLLGHIAEALTSFEVAGLSPSFEVWLRKQLAANVGYDKLVTELLTVPVSQSRRPTPQPTPTPQPKPTEQRPQPTAPPQPRPAEQSQALPDTSRTSPASIHPCASSRCKAGYSDPFSTWSISSELRWMCFAMAWPCAGPNTSVRRIRRSSVPGRSSGVFRGVPIGYRWKCGSFGWSCQVITL